MPYRYGQFPAVNPSQLLTGYNWEFLPPSDRVIGAGGWIGWDTAKDAVWFLGPNAYRDDTQFASPPRPGMANFRSGFPTQAQLASAGITQSLSDWLKDHTRSFAQLEGSRLAHMTPTTTPTPATLAGIAANQDLLRVQLANLDTSLGSVNQEAAAAKTSADAAAAAAAATPASSGNNNVLLLIIVAAVALFFFWKR